MEDIKKELAKQYIIDNWDLYSYKQELAADVKDAFIYGPLGENEHYNIDEIWSIVQEVETGIVPPVEIVPPTDGEILDKLVADGVITQELVDAVVEELTPVAIEIPPVEEVIKEKPIIDTPLQEETVITE